MDLRKLVRASVIFHSIIASEDNIVDITEQLAKNKLKQKFEKATPENEMPINTDQLAGQRDRKFLNEIQEAVGVWLHRFSDVRKDDQGFFILKTDNPAGKEMSPGQLLADFAINQTPYWSITSIQGNRINLKPIGSNPFVTGVGAGGAKLTQFDFDVFTGESERKRINIIKEKLENGTASIDDAKYLLDGTVPVHMGPNGAQGGWYNAEDSASRGGRQGMKPKQIMLADAKKLRDWGFAGIPIAAINGSMAPYEWNNWISGSHPTEDYIPRDLESYIDFHRKMTEKGRWRYSEEAIQDLYKKYQNAQQQQSLYLSEGEDDSEESILRNIFHQERRVAIRNTVQLIEMAKENPKYIKYLHDMIALGGADYIANEKVIEFFDLVDDIDGLKIAAEKLTDPDNLRYAYSYLMKTDPEFVLKRLNRNTPIDALKSVIYKLSEQMAKEKRTTEYKDWVIKFFEDNDIFELIKEKTNNPNDFYNRMHCEELLGIVLRSFHDISSVWLNIRQERIDELKFDRPDLYEQAIKERSENAKYMAFTAEASKLLQSLKR